jgi:hypothetical protein
MAGIDVQLLPTSSTTFYSEDNLELTFVFRKDANERITYFALMIGDVEMNGGPKQN